MTAVRHQQGVALVAVLMIIAIVVVIAVNMTGRLQLQLQRQQNVQQQQQAFWYAMGAEQFAKVLLSRTLAGEESVNLGQDWALQGATFPVENGTIAGDIIDLHSCFNINALQNVSAQNGNRNEQSPAQKAFLRLLELKGSELSMPAEYLVARLGDWLDEDSLLSTAGSAEDDDYASLQFPYYAANGLMASVSELRVILDLTPADYQLLAPYVCVIPEDNNLVLNGDDSFVSSPAGLCLQLQTPRALLELHLLVVRQVDRDGLGAGVGVAAVVDGEVGVEVGLGGLGQGQVA